MKREMTAEEKQAAEKIFSELVGFTIDQAKDILKAVLTRIGNKAIIEDGE